MDEKKGKRDSVADAEGPGDVEGRFAPDEQEVAFSAPPAEAKVGKGPLRGGLDCYADLSTGTDIYEQDFFMRKDPVRNTHWSIAWSDLMMTMFVLFMVMFVYKSADREFLSGEGGGSLFGEKIGREYKEQGPGGSNEFHVFGEKAFSKIYDFSKLTSLEKELKEFAEIDLEPDKTLRIILTGDLLFPLGKSDIMGGGLESLRKIAVFLQETPYKINVVGHTDDLPIGLAGTPGNWELSTNRACAVVHYLIAETKLPASQFYVTGHAEFRPVVPNNSPENRSKNRRVEIVITKEMPGAMPIGFADL